MRLLNLEILGRDAKRYTDLREEYICAEGNVVDLKPGYEDPTIDFENSIAFPGLINSHDHLEFNLFPRLGNKKYEDYVEWGDDIHASNKDIIEDIITIPVDLRTQYGVYKNLINGVTTVVNHGNLKIKNNYLIDVFSGYNYFHSVRLEKNWRIKLNLKLNGFPFVIHIGEGTNAESYNEINNLIHWNIFNRSIVGVHGISMDAGQAAHFKALVWCPASNNFLYGSTCRVDELKKNTTILFGTDSNVSAGWNLWEHLRFAREYRYLDDYELYKTLSSNAANVWNLKNKGTLLPGSFADIIIADKKAGNFLDSFYNLDPGDILMIIKNGKILLFDSKLLNQLSGSIIDISSFTEINIGDRNKFIKGRLDELCRRIKMYSSNLLFPFDVF
ncbi:MAG: amidohydrolase family protein [Ignavibacteriaceae bacterium]